MLKRPITPPANNPAMDYQTADSDHVLKRSRPFGISDEVCNCHFKFQCLIGFNELLALFVEILTSWFLYVFFYVILKHLTL